MRRPCRDADERERAGDRHREALADARDRPPGGEIAEQLTDDERGGHQCRRGDVGAELGRDDGISGISAPSPSANSRVGP